VPEADRVEAFLWVSLGSGGRSATPERRSPWTRTTHPRVGQEGLGHRAIAITLGIYSHVVPTLHDEAAELVSDPTL